MKKIIQVPIDEGLLKDIDSISRDQHKPRAKFIREACQSYMQKLETDELDRAYQQGYERIPEQADTSEAQLKISDKMLPEESW
jgi:metal-responsive CopG/Arc/MetJ family transcriptional regulator